MYCLFSSDLSVAYYVGELLAKNFHLLFYDTIATLQLGIKASKVYILMQEKENVAKLQSNIKQKNVSKKRLVSFERL